MPDLPFAPMYVPSRYRRLSLPQVKVMAARTYVCAAPCLWQRRHTLGPCGHGSGGVCCTARTQTQPSDGQRSSGADPRRSSSTHFSVCSFPAAGGVVWVWCKCTNDPEIKHRPLASAPAHPHPAWSSPPWRERSRERVPAGSPTASQNSSRRGARRTPGEEGKNTPALSKTRKVGPRSQHPSGAGLAQRRIVLRLRRH